MNIENVSKTFAVHWHNWTKILPMQATKSLNFKSNFAPRQKISIDILLREETNLYFCRKTFWHLVMNRQQWQILEASYSLKTEQESNQTVFYPSLPPQEQLCHHHRLIEEMKPVVLEMFRVAWWLTISYTFPIVWTMSTLMRWSKLRLFWLVNPQNAIVFAWQVHDFQGRNQTFCDT